MSKLTKDLDFLIASTVPATKELLQEQMSDIITLRGAISMLEDSEDKNDLQTLKGMVRDSLEEFKASLAAVEEWAND